MGKRLEVILLAVALSVVAIVNGNAANVVVKPKGREKSMKIQRKLKLLNKPATKTIYSRDGDIIDCVDIYKQPAFDHPALRNHTIQLKPSFDKESKMSTAQNESFRSIPFQIWQKSGSCPRGTIPIRRIRKQDLMRTTSLDHFGKKILGNIKLGPEINRSTAILITTGYNYIGASGDINVWNSRVDLPNDFTASQVWLKNGPSAQFESVEAGWVINPMLYGDTNTRFNVYWTVDSYKSTGCFDLTCSGFVQTNPQVALGAAIQPLSSKGGDQHIISVGIFMDPSTSNWWLKLQENIVVGYWPPTLFSYLRHSATLVEWGGEVYSSNLKTTPHTATAMGSGDYASGLFQYASFINRPRILDYSLQLKYPERVGIWADEPFCYSAYNYQRTYTSEPVFYYGGPGRSRDCQ